MFLFISIANISATLLSQILKAFYFAFFQTIPSVYICRVAETCNFFVIFFIKMFGVCFALTLWKSSNILGCLGTI